MNITELKNLIATKTGNEPKPSGEGFICRCPAHDDQTASLSISAGRDALLLNCHAGCTFEAVTAALGIKPEGTIPRERHGEKWQASENQKI